MPNKPLSMDQIEAILSQSRSGGPRKDPTEPRVHDVWFKLDHIIREQGCDNPECTDPRPKEDRGVNIVALIHGKHMCRVCFLKGWLSVAQEESTSSDTSSASD